MKRKPRGKKRDPIDQLRQDCARSAAEEALDCLYTAFWAHSFNGEKLEEALTSMMLFALTEALPTSVGLDEEEIEAA